MDIDKDGRLWLSSFGGSEIIKLDPRLVLMSSNISFNQNEIIGIFIYFSISEQAM